MDCVGLSGVSGASATCKDWEWCLSPGLKRNGEGEEACSYIHAVNLPDHTSAKPLPQVKFVYPCKQTQTKKTTIIADPTETKRTWYELSIGEADIQNTDQDLISQWVEGTAQR